MKLMTVFISLPFIVFSTCNTKGTKKDGTRAEEEAPPKQSEQPVNIDKAKPVALTPSTVKEFTAWASGSDVGEKEAVRESIAKASKDGEVLKQLFAEYEKVKTSDVGYSLVVLSVIGEMQNPASLPGLRDIIYTQLPKPKEEPHAALTELDLVEMLASKAVECAAYLKTAESNRLVLEVVAKHPSQAVRSAAIDAYLYNNGDTEKAKATVSRAAQEKDRILVDRTRFAKGGKKEAFDRQLEIFYKKYPQEVAEQPGEPEKTDRKKDTVGTAKSINPPKRNQR